LLSLSSFLGQDVLIPGKSTHAHRPHLHNGVGAGRLVVSSTNYRTSRKARYVVGCSPGNQWWHVHVHATDRLFMQKGSSQSDYISMPRN